MTDNNDTVSLLRECDAGIKMGVASINEVIPHIKSDEFKKYLDRCKNSNEELRNEIDKLLGKYGDDGKEPMLMAKGMSWFKTNMKIAIDESDATAADLITDGCNMGIKSLRKYLNQYGNADGEVKSVVNRLIKLEEELLNEVKKYL